jgi:LysR family transcriptional regulator, glycine cleavage system transcriptional activator
MPSWYPPTLSSIRAFEAAARLSSFTRAAEDLNITQGAVSHSVRELETRLKVDLFVRTNRTLKLTDAGRLYLPFAAQALSLLRDGERAFLDPARRDHVITVSVSPSFAAKWLVPRLGAFVARYPDIDLRISASAAHVDFRDGEIDLAVRHGDGDWPTLQCTRLCEEMLFPVCSPLLKNPPRKLSDLARHVLIHHRDNEAWKAWLAAVGERSVPDPARGIVLNEMSLAIDAAVAGQGIALARTALAARDVEEGRLIRPMAHETPAEFAYWIVYPRSARKKLKIARFEEWLLGEA